MSASNTNTGFSFSFGALIWIMIAGAATVSLLDELFYSANDEPTAIATIEEFSRLEGGDFVRVTGRLDYDNALVASKAVGDDFLLAPVVGFHNALWVSVKNGTVPMRDTADVTFEGRVEARSGSEWKVGDTRDLDLTYESRKLGMLPVTNKALVLRDGVRPGDGLTAFTWIAGIIGALILFSYLSAFAGALAGLVRRSDPQPVAGVQNDTAFSS